MADLISKVKVLSKEIVFLVMGIFLVGFLVSISNYIDWKAGLPRTEKARQAASEWRKLSGLEVARERLKHPKGWETPVEQYTKLLKRRKTLENSVPPINLSARSLVIAGLASYLIVLIVRVLFWTLNSRKSALGWRPTLLLLCSSGILCALVWNYFWGPCGQVAVSAASKEMKGALAQWEDATALADSTARIALSGPVSELQRIMAGVRHPVPGCLSRTQDHLINAMKFRIDGYLEFMSEREFLVAPSWSLSEKHMQYFKETLESVERCAPYCEPDLQVALE